MTLMILGSLPLVFSYFFCETKLYPSLHIRPQQSVDYDPVGIFVVDLENDDDGFESKSE